MISVLKLRSTLSKCVGGGDVKVNENKAILIDLSQ